MKVENAKIESTSLGYEDHGILTFFLHCTMGGVGQGFGGFGLDGIPLERKPGSRRQPHPFAGGCIAEILRVVGVNSWEELPGKYIRVHREHEHGSIVGISNILDGSNCFFPADFYERMFGNSEHTNK